MYRRVPALALVLCLCLAAQTTLSIEQLIAFIKSSVQLKQDDRQVAGFLSHCKLTESLDDRTIEELQGFGAGPRTVRALQQLRDASRALPQPRFTPPPPVPAPIPPPSSAEQAQVLDDVRDNALNYVKSLPDFICTQVTRRYVDPTGLEFWRSADTLTARLTYFEQKENYKLVLINSRPTDQAYDSVGGATSTGEFGSMLREIFEAQSKTRFDWSRWATLRKRRAYVFSYRVAQPFSRWHIDYEKRMEIIAGYHGEIFVDRDTHMVMRVTLEAEDIPRSFPVQSARTVLDYDFEKIADREYLLPLRAEVRMRADKLLTKNEVEFRMYRKFSAESQLKFEADTPPPLTDDQTKEQPPK